MFLKEQGNSFVPELNPAPLEDILSRFEDVVMVKSGKIPEGEIFFPTNYPPEKLPRLETYVGELTCPFYDLVVTAGELAGLKKEEVGEFFCGETAKEVDLEELIGTEKLTKKGTEYAPFSQCWRIALELKTLHNFMVSSESGQIMNEKEIKEKVIACWKEILLKWFRKNLGERLHFQQLVYDSRTEFETEEEERRVIVDGVEGVLGHLVPLVGENFSELSTPRTAEFCGKRPRNSYFNGEMS